MENAKKILGIIALVAIIGFGFTSCDDGDDGNGGSVNKILPDFFVPNAPYSHIKQGNWVSGSDELIFVIDSGIVSRIKISSDTFNVTEITGKTIKVEYNPHGNTTPYVFCTDYTMSNNNKTVVFTSIDFADEINGKTFNLKED